VEIGARMKIYSGDQGLQAKVHTPKAETIVELDALMSSILDKAFKGEL